MTQKTYRLGIDFPTLAADLLAPKNRQRLLEILIEDTTLDRIRDDVAELAEKLFIARPEAAVDEAFQAAWRFKKTAIWYSAMWEKIAEILDEEDLDEEDENQDA